MNIYLLSQDENNDYDTYDSCVVAANNEDEARLLKPGNDPWGYEYSSWCSDPKYVEVKLIGTTDLYNEPKIILASFNAG